MIYCVRHPGREAAFHCSRCQHGLCADCVQERKLGPTVMQLCPECDVPVARLTAYRLPLPFWRRLPGVVFYPLRGAGWFLLAGWMVFGAVMLGTPAAMVSSFEDVHYHDIFNIFAVLIYYTVLFALGHRFIAASAEGEIVFPSLETRDGPYERFKEMVPRVIGPGFAVFWPSVVTGLFFWSTYNQDPGPLVPFFINLTLGVFLATLAAGLFLLPMAVLVINVTGNVMNAVNLPLVWRQVRTIPRDYLAGWAAWLILIAVYVGARLLMAPVRAAHHPAPVYLAYAVDSLIQLYLVEVFGHVLGSIYFLDRFKLRWFAVHERVPEFLVGGKVADMRPDDPKSVALMVSAGMMAAAQPSVPSAAPAPAGPPPEVAEHLREGSYLMQHGNYERAAENFRAALDHAPDHFEALRGLAMAALRMEDEETVTFAGRKIATELVAQGALEAVWDMYQGYRQTFPDFTFEPGALLALARWLEPDQPLPAARLLRELAVTFPDAPEAPAALLRCGQLLHDRCDLAEKAKAVWKVLTDRYPDSEPAATAKKAAEEPLAKL